MELRTQTIFFNQNKTLQRCNKSSFHSLNRGHIIPTKRWQVKFISEWYKEFRKIIYRASANWNTYKIMKSLLNMELDLPWLSIQLQYVWESNHEASWFLTSQLSDIFPPSKLAGFHSQTTKDRKYVGPPCTSGISCYLRLRRIQICPTRYQSSTEPPVYRVGQQELPNE